VIGDCKFVLPCNCKSSFPLCVISLCRLEDFNHYLSPLQVGTVKTLLTFVNRYEHIDGFDKLQHSI